MIAARRWYVHLAVMFVGIWLAGLFPGARAAHADPVQVRAATQDGKARIVFNWPAPVTYEATLTGDRLRIRFGRAVDADVAAGLAPIKSYVRGASITNGGQEVDVRLAPGTYSLSHFTAGTAIVVDVVGKPGSETAPVASKPAAPEKAASESSVTASEPAASTTQPVARSSAQSVVAGPEVGVRTGRHSDKLRIVFDWNKNVAFNVERGNGVSTINFAAPAMIDVASINGVERKLVGEARTRPTSNGTAVDLAIPDSSRLNVFRIGAKVVADVYFPSDGALAGQLPAAPAGGAETATANSGDTSENTNDGGSAQTDVAKPAAGASVTAETSASTAQAPAAAAPTEPNAQAGAPKALDASAVSPTAESSGEQAKSDSAIPIRVAPRTDGEPGFVVSFDWNDPVGAAVFRRGGALWLVFDKHTPVDVARIRNAAGGQLIDISQLPNPNGTVLRMITAQGINPVAKRDGLTWIVEFKKQPLSTLASIPAKPQLNSPVGTRIFMPVPEPGRVVPITDPEIGDNFVVVPIIPLGYGVTHLYQYPQFRVRPSSQGVVIEPRIDTLRVRPLREGIEITSTRKLQISPISPEELAGTGVNDNRKLSRIVNFEPVRDVKLSHLIPDRERLEHEIAVSRSPEEKNKLQLDLAQFYLANGLGAEALGVLEEREREDQAAAQELPQRLYKAMAEFLLDRPKEALATLDGAPFQVNDEGIFWRSIAGFAAGDRSGDVLRGIRSSILIPDTYPTALRVPTTLWALEGLIQVGDSLLAKKIIKSLKPEDLTEEQKRHRDLLEAAADRIDGDVEVALSRLEQLAKDPTGPSQVRAAVERVRLMLELNRMTPLAAAKELENLRYSWRGGEFEFNLLRHLGNLYLSAGKFRKGLETLKQAATYFRDNPDAPKITETMVEAFNALFLNGLADRIPPVAAIGLYEEFKELTPAGNLGDKMIQNLADRLVSIDLLDNAAALLDAQVKYRLSGPDKARVGNRLALIYLLNGEYEKAVAALDESVDPAMTPEVGTQRRLLRARAMMGKSDPAAALTLIKDDKGLPADQLRTEIYWGQGNWREASKSLRNMMDAKGIEAGKPLDKTASLYVLNYAIALTLSGNERGVARVRRDYGAEMEKTPLKDAFELIAKPDGFGLLDVAQVADKVSEAQKFESFLSKYKDQLATAPLSAIN